LNPLLNLGFVSGFLLFRKVIPAIIFQEKSYFTTSFATFRFFRIRQLFVLLFRHGLLYARRREDQGANGEQLTAYGGPLPLYPPPPRRGNLNPTTAPRAPAGTPKKDVVASERSERSNLILLSWCYEIAASLVSKHSLLAMTETPAASIPSPYPPPPRRGNLHPPTALRALAGTPKGTISYGAQHEDTRQGENHPPIRIEGS